MIAATWEQHCAEYRPGEFGRHASPATIKRETNTLELLLDRARGILDAGVIIPRRIRDTRREETACGTCYGNAA